MMVEGATTEAGSEFGVDAPVMFRLWVLSNVNRKTNACFCLHFAVINCLQNVLFLGPDKRFLLKFLSPKLC